MGSSSSTTYNSTDIFSSVNNTNIQSTFVKSVTNITTTTIVQTMISESSNLQASLMASNKLVIDAGNSTCASGGKVVVSGVDQTNNLNSDGTITTTSEYKGKLSDLIQSNVSNALSAQANMENASAVSSKMENAAAIAAGALQGAVTAVGGAVGAVCTAVDPFTSSSTHSTNLMSNKTLVNSYNAFMTTQETYFNQQTTTIKNTIIKLSSDLITTLTGINDLTVKTAACDVEVSKIKQTNNLNTLLKVISDSTVADDFANILDTTVSNITKASGLLKNSASDGEFANAAMSATNIMAALFSNGSVIGTTFGIGFVVCMIIVVLTICYILIKRLGGSSNNDKDEDDN